MLNLVWAKRFNKFADIVAIIVAFSIFLPFIIGSSPIPLIIFGYVLLVLLIASFVVKGAVYKQAQDKNWAAQFWALVFGGIAIGFFLFW